MWICFCQCRKDYTLCFCLIFALCSCSKDEASQNAEKIISILYNATPETLSSEERTEAYLESLQPLISEVFIKKFVANRTVAEAQLYAFTTMWI